MNGLWLMENFLNSDEEQLLLQTIDSKSWDQTRHELRRVQVYGPVHDADFRITNQPSIPFPPIIEALGRKIQLTLPHLSNCLYDYQHTEVFVNEYTQSDRLHFHYDQRRTYAEPIFGVSICSAGVLTFRKGRSTTNEKNDSVLDGSTSRRELDIPIPRYSLYVMTGEARYQWQHGIYPGRLDQERRISITYRIIQ